MDRVSKGTNLQRVRILNDIARAAPFLADRALELVEYIIQNPSEVDEDLDGMYTFRDRDVRKKLAPILRVIAYHNTEYLPRCCDLLWELGKGMPGNIAPEPEHPVRILADFASYRYPQQFQPAVLDAVSRWLEEPGVYDYVNSLLEVLNPILARTETDFSSRGLELTITGYRIQYDAARPLRERAIELLADLTRSGVPRIILAALNSLETALRPPLHRCEIPDDEMSTWYPEYVKILGVFEELITRTSDPVVLVHIIRSLKGVVQAWGDTPLGEEINRILAEIPDSLELRLTRTLLYGSNSYPQKDDSIQQVIQEYLKFIEDGTEMFDDLNTRQDHIQQAGVSLNPGRFLYLLSRCQPEIAREWVEKIILNPDTPLALYLSSILSGLREDDRELTVHLIRKVMDTGNTVLINGIATGYAEGWWRIEIQEDEIDIVQGLLEHLESAVRQYAITSLGGFPAPLREEARTLALDTDIGNDPSLASSLCAVLSGFDLSTLTDDQLTVVLSRLKRTSRLDPPQDLWISLFLEACAARVPERVADLFVERIAIATSGAGIPGYQPLFYPGLGFSLDGIYQSGSYSAILRSMRDKALETYEADGFWMPHLYADLSNQFSPESVEILEEWIDVEDEKKLLCVGYLLQEAPADFLFTHTKFVSRLIESSYRTGRGCYEAVCSYLQMVGAHGAGFGDLKEPVPADVQMRDSARECMGRFQKGSSTRRFYEQIAESCNRRIEFQKKWSENLLSTL